MPFDLVVDSYNTLYINDCFNNRVQFWSGGATSGVTIAETGKQMKEIKAK
jgi:hypothetical protein